ncbi:hypothetical protein PRIPAC_90090 [Pristionchus pacificus]|uniref:Uncharacterized protein n=1 Tax=Pristionchus pacificus TaxID=54126 RepID=A0A454XI04_PRIPA|nr:hypothetical protein PRIPAC_90090 [Pristionchus pacificus]|eukprot:PDM82067.1 hypothetical protein PRIPAC_36460 [Pristionchus pacificus]
MLLKLEVLPVGLQGLDGRQDFLVLFRLPKVQRHFLLTQRRNAGWFHHLLRRAKYGEDALDGLKMRFFLLFILALLTVSSALECYEGVIPVPKYGELSAKPKLTKCTNGEKCCRYLWNDIIGRTYNCEKQCPDFKGQSEIHVPKSVGFANYCKKAKGGCKYT